MQSATDGGGACFTYFLSKAEINESHREISMKDNVRGLQVSEGIFSLVNLLEGETDLSCYVLEHGSWNFLERCQ